MDDGDFTFRLRFVVPRSRRLPFETERVALSEGSSRASIALVSAEKNTTIEDAQHVALVGSGFPSEELALQAGDEWRSRLEHAFASMDILADFGERLGPRGGFTPDMLELMTNAAGVAQMNDVHGLMVYQSDLKPMFWRGEATGIARPLSGDVLRAIALADDKATIRQEARLAFHLWSASRFVEQPDGRFMVLMMAFETLIDQDVKRDDVRNHIDALIAATEESGLTDEEKRSLSAGLANLKQESINQAGRRLASTMGARLYGGATAVELWAGCYRARNKLVHGHADRPSLSEIGLQAAHLEILVGHLIAGRALVDDVLGPPDDASDGH